jgi:protein SCO1/2
MRNAIIAVLLAAGGLFGATPWGLAHDMHQHAMGAKAAAKAAQVTVHDIGLVDREAHPVRFKSEAVGNRIVLIDFIYTRCTTICPVTSAVFAELQQRLIERLGQAYGREVALITLSIDPATDTPERLNDYAQHFGVPAGWLWLTGEKPQVNKVLAGLGAYSADLERHSGAILVGDGLRGDWTRFSGIPDPAALVSQVEHLLAARGPANISKLR